MLYYSCRISYTRRKHYKYGLDAPAVVIGYITVGILFLILGITISFLEKNL